MKPSSEALLKRGAEALGLAIEPQLPQFAQLLGCLVAGNQRLNLTALKTEEEIVLKHFIDSLTCLRGDLLEGELRVLDLGTGAGFPALPLAIMCPALQLYPLDSTRKKIQYVHETAQALRLEQVQPLVGRAEALGRQTDYRERFDRVVVRAVAALPTLVELALPLLKLGGLLIAQKGALSDEEWQAGQRAAAELGGQVKTIDRFHLPISGDQRTLVVIEKTRATPPQYPRREGIPHGQPLFFTIEQPRKR